MMQIFYDDEGDVLYLSIGDPRPAISEELDEDVLLRHDIETGEVVGLTVLHFSSRSKNSQKLPVEIDLRALTS